MADDSMITQLLGMAGDRTAEFPNFEVAVAAAEAAAIEYRSRCLSVWRELQAIDPHLIGEIRAQGWEDAIAAEWLFRPNLSGRTAISAIRDGNREEALSLLRTGQASWS